jgi:lipoprotein-releasing system ATP-binding protein
LGLDIDFNMPIISAKNITKTFFIKGEKKNCVLNDISLDIERGKITALMGASGVGKTTLLYILGALDAPDSGEVLFKSDTGEEFLYKNMSSDELAKLRNKHIGFVFQFHHLLPEFNVLENVMMPTLISGASQNKAEEKALYIMEKMQILHIKKQRPNELSGGEQQRAAIARALVNSPEIIFADEPTGNLDSATAINMLKLIKEINAELGTTFLIVTHSEEMADCADTIINMKDGKVYYQ